MTLTKVAVALLFISNLKSATTKLNEPDYDSGWVLVSSRNNWNDRMTHVKKFNHGFEELPMIVDVQVKAIDGPNKGYVFPASGHGIRDDDRNYPFGQVIYIYDNTTILVSPPIRNNGKLGYCIYTGKSPFWEGPANQASYSALVRARAWRSSSLPRPDFTHKGSRLTSSTGRREDSYLSVKHGLDEYPSLVVSRIRFPDGPNYPNYYADSVGSGSIIYTRYADNERNGYVIYGFDNSSIRVWAPSRPWGFLYSGGEGGSGIDYKVTSAVIELYAWREKTLNPTETLRRALSPERISSSDLTIAFRQTYQTDDILIKSWVEAVDGVNSGYRFLGSGALAYDAYTVSQPCSYGGLVYGYTNSSMRLWKPGKATNGALICLQAKLAEGFNTQASSRGIANVNIWKLGNEGSVRIRGGWTKYSGVVEVYINSTWNQICLDGFSQSDATTVCNILGHTGANESIQVHSNVFFGKTKTSPTIGNLRCNGSEETLLDCGQGNWKTEQQICNKGTAAVNCRSRTSIRIMSGDQVLSVGNSPVTGRVEILYNGNWGSICDDQFDDKDAHVLCSMLGFSFGKPESQVHGSGSGATIIDDLECLGIEKDVSDCKAKYWGTHDCREDETAVIHCDHAENIDPCKSRYHTRLPDLEFRYVSTSFEDLQQNHNDSKLPYRWYNVGANTMPESKPKIGQCGTYYPIYSLDKAPYTIGNVRTIRAKQVDGLALYNVQVKKCKDFYVYRLPSTINDRSAYCIGIGSEGSSPTFKINRTEAVVMHNETDIWFECIFEEAQEDLFYQVYWNIEGNSRATIVKGYCDHSNMSELHLNERDFVDNEIQLGINIICEVRPYLRPYGKPGPKSSNPIVFYAGLDIKTPKLKIRSGETSSVQVVNTIPLVCNQSIKKYCNMTLKYTVAEQSTCTSMPAFPKGCEMQLRPDRVGQVNVVDITTTETGQYNVPRKYSLNMEVDPTIDGLKLWRKSDKLKDIEIDIYEEAITQWRGKICSARNDPHMFTFDGRKYEHHESDGEYVLYRHKQYTNVEIQHKIFACYPNARVKCNCGVAVRVGRDVYVIDVCNGSLAIGYKLCGDGVLTTMKENDFTYRIILPYGTSVAVRIDNILWSRKGPSKVLDISLYPSLYDTDAKTVGLCGNLNGNTQDDFVQKNNVLASDKTITDFILSWRVSSNESLFSGDIKSMNLDHWLSSKCICQRGSRRSVHCERPSTGCSKGTKTGHHSCGSESPRRSVRSVTDHLRIPNVRQTLSSARILRKRQTNPDIRNWTTEEAIEYCKTYFERLEAYQLCRQIPTSHTNISLENCILDIQLTNSVEWTSLTEQAMQDNCISEIDRNTTVRNYLKEIANNTANSKNGSKDGANSIKSEIENLEKNVIQEIKEHSCLNNCSGNGLCIQGNCSCSEGYGASDCSIDMNEPPRIEGLLDDGFCDEFRTPCSYLYVFGEVFIGNEVICRLLEFQIDVKGRKIFRQDHVYVKGFADSLVEAVCDMRQLEKLNDANEDTFVRGYHIAMSNDGEHYSNEPAEVYIFDSTCQTYYKNGNSIQFILKEGFCFIDGRCVARGVSDPSRARYCDPTMSKYSWTKIPTTTLLTSPLPSLTSSPAQPLPNVDSTGDDKKLDDLSLTSLNIGLIIATASVSSISILLTTGVCYYYRRKQNTGSHSERLIAKDFSSRRIDVTDSSTFSNPAYGVMHD